MGGVLAVAVVVVVILTSVGGGSSTPTTPVTPTTPSAPALPKIGPLGFAAPALAAYVTGTLHQTVYWAGPDPVPTGKAGYLFELTRTSNNNAYVRYLPPGVKVGDPRSSYLIIATYPFPNALARLKAIAHHAGTTLPDGAFVLPDASYPKSVHMAFPNVPFEIEVYDPSSAVAKHIALASVIVPVP